MITDVETQEVVGAPERQEELANTLPNALFADHQVSPANHGARHQEPAHRISTIAFEHLGYIGVVPQALRHFLTIRTQHDSMGNHLGKSGAVKQGGGENVHGVKPAPGLPDVFHDEVSRVVGLEPFLILKGIVNLRKGHRTRVKPHV